MKRIVSIVMAFLAISVMLGAQTKVMSHRGYYAHPGSFENTLTSLRGAQMLGVEGVELDVHLSTDDSLVILHGPKIAGSEYKDIQKLDFKTIRSCVLPNGDKVPTLREYFTQAKKTAALMLFLELKAHPTKERETTLAEKVVALCDEMNMYDQVTFISFSEHLCDEILRLRKGTKVIPISSSKAYTTEELLRRGYAGVSYHMGVVMNRTHLLDEAHEAGRALLELVEAADRACRLVALAPSIRIRENFMDVMPISCGYLLPYGIDFFKDWIVCLHVNLHSQVPPFVPENPSAL